MASVGRLYGSWTTSSLGFNGPKSTKLKPAGRFVLLKLDGLFDELGFIFLLFDFNVA